MKIKNIKLCKDCESINVEFEHNGKKGYFDYTFFGDYDTKGIGECNYDESPSNKNEEILEELGDGIDIYQVIHDWVEKNIEAKCVIKYKGEILK